MKRMYSMIVAILLIAAAHPAMAQIQVNTDENGGGTYTYFGTHNWGGFVTKSSPPVYHLEAALAAVTPPGPNPIVTPGDVIVNEVATAQISSDLLRFDNNGNLTVFSDIEANEPPPLDLADVGVPAPGTNVVILPETSPSGGPPVEGGVNGLFGYQPGPGMPGGFPNGVAGTISYNFYSDGSVPEPSTGMMAVLACGLVWWKRKSFRRIV
ncbi:MAG TPA: hypothetical protein VGY55_11335 [Pirellulales bacterium]|jgi:hypothetical protein|nr:hypothetical protein [Pirellulales bacterium]